MERRRFFRYPRKTAGKTASWINPSPPPAWRQHTLTICPSSQNSLAEALQTIQIPDYLHDHHVTNFSFLIPTVVFYLQRTFHIRMLPKMSHGMRSDNAVFIIEHGLKPERGMGIDEFL